MSSLLPWHAVAQLLNEPLATRQVLSLEGARYLVHLPLILTNPSICLDAGCQGALADVGGQACSRYGNGTWQGS